MPEQDTRLERIEELIVTATETIEKARKCGAVWLINAAEKELNFARYEKERCLKRLMERNDY